MRDDTLHCVLQAERLFDAKDDDTFVSLTNLAAAMKAVVEKATDTERLALINNHPDLAGKAALAGEVTAESSEEQVRMYMFHHCRPLLAVAHCAVDANCAQARAGLNSLTQEELDRFNALNKEYKDKFGFVFIFAVRNATKGMILDAFERRLKNSQGVEVLSAWVVFPRGVALFFTATICFLCPMLLGCGMCDTDPPHRVDALAGEVSVEFEDGLLDVPRS